MRQHSGLERRTAKNSIRIPAAEKGALFARTDLTMSSYPFADNFFLKPAALKIVLPCRSNA